MRLSFFLKEAFRALRRSAAPSLAAILTVLLTALVLGVFIPIVQATTGTANEVRGRVIADVYVKEGVGDQQVQELGDALRAQPNVASVEFIPKEEALKRERERNPEAYDLLGGNPLPDTFRVTPQDPDGVNALVDRLRTAAAGGEGDRKARGGAVVTPENALTAIDEVRNREDETNDILSATGLVKVLATGLAALLIFASVALVANTIRLSIFARRREVEVMRLVGATNWFIRWPFVIEGVFVGFAGGLLAIIVLAVAKVSVIDQLEERFALLAAPDTIDFTLLAFLLLFACVVVSAIGSGLTLRRFLRI